MCRNIRTLFNFEPPVNAEEIRAASLQFVRKISGFNKPSKPNEAAFIAAVNAVAEMLPAGCCTHSKPPRRREESRGGSAALRCQASARS